MIRLGKFDKEGYKQNFSKGELARELVFMNKDYEALKKENQKYKEVINRLSKIIYEIDELRKNTGGYPTDYMDNLVNILKEVEDEKKN